MAGQTAELGTAFISVVPDTGGLAKGIKEALAQSEKNAPKSGNAIGQGLTAGINKTLKAGVVGVGVAAGGVLAGSIAKGLGRLSGIDNAKAKLSGLGHEAEAVSGIMDDALASVKGTAFGLEDAATIAASAVAAGIGPGEDLQRTLKLTADAATIAGTDLSSMGSIINKVATSDMMQMDVANQLMDAGIPILQMVGEEMGVTAEEARKLASEGKISFETFQNALDTGVGGAALKSGETVQGAFANMGAAAGRFGAKLAEPVFNAAPAVFGAVGDAFDTLGEKLEPLIEDFADWLAPRMEDFAENTVPKLVDGVMEAVDAFMEFGGWVKDNAEWIKPLAAGIGGAVAAIYAWNTATTIAKGVQAAFNTIVAANPIMLIVVAVAAVTAALVYFFTQTETGKELWEKFTSAFVTAWEWAKGAVTAGIDWIVTKFGDMQSGISTLWESYVSPILTWISDKWDWLKFQVQKFIFEIQRNIYLFQSAVSDLWDKYISPILTWISDKWDELKNRLITAYNNIKTAVIDAFSNALTWFRDNVVTPVIDFFVEKWDWLKTKLHEGWTWIDTNVISAFRSGLDGFKSFFDGIVDGIGKVWDSLRGKLAKPINFMINTVYNDGILKAWNTIADMLPGLEPGRRVAAIAGYAAGGQVQRDPTGAVRGPGTGTSDSILARIANGEHILTAAEVAKAGGHGVIYAMRDLISHGRAFSFDGRGGLVGLGKQLSNKAGDLAGAAPGLFLPRFAKGGEVRPLWERQLERGHAFAKAQHGKPYQWGGPGGQGQSFDCSGYMGSIAAEIQGANPWQRYWATMSFANGNTAQGFVPGLGPGFSIGLFNGGPYGGHTAGTLGTVGNYTTTNVESGGSPSMVKYGVGAVGADHSQFTHRYHLPIGADGAFVSGGAGGFDFLGAVKKWVTDKLTGILDPIKGLLPQGPPAWQDIPRGLYDATVGEFKDFMTEKVSGLGELASGVWGRITDLFDNGGWLMPGRMAANKSGKPEPILTDLQWAMVSRLLRQWPGAMESMTAASEAMTATSETLDNLNTALSEWAVEMQPVVRKSAEDYAMEQGSALLSPMGLEGVIPLAQKVGAKVWDALHAQPVEPANASPTVVEIEATGGDFVHVDDLEAVNDRVDSLEVKVNRKPAAATVTRGGAL